MKTKKTIETIETIDTIDTIDTIETIETKKAGERIRTADPLITNQLLYQLSYTSTKIEQNNIQHQVIGILCNPNKKINH